MSTTVQGGEYSYNVTSGSSGAEDEIMLEFVDEDGITFDPKMIVHSPSPM